MDPTFGGFLKGSAKLTTGNSESYTDQAAVSEQIEQLTVYMRGNALVVYRESERGIDLTGSTLVKITFKAEPQSIDSQWIVTSSKLVDDKTGRLLTPDKASLSISLAQFAHPNDLTVKAAARYIQRHVIKGEDSYSENDDQVQLINDQLCLGSSGGIVPFLVTLTLPGTAVRAPRIAPLPLSLVPMSSS